MSRRLVVVDQETTGTDLEHQSTEIGYYDLSTDRYGVFVPSHSLAGADPVALDISRYHARIAKETVDNGGRVREFHSLLGGDGTPTSVICANPAFDVRFLMGVFARQGLKQNPFHYRPFDVEEGAYWLFPDRFAAGEKPGLKQIATLLGVEMPCHHSALADVFTAVAIWRMLEKIRATVRVDLDAISKTADFDAIRRCVPIGEIA